MNPSGSEGTKMKPNRNNKEKTHGTNLSQSQIQLVKQEFSGAKSYASEYRGNTAIAHFFNTRVNRVSEFLREFKSGRVLDVGCGPAIIGNTFRGRPVEYYGVDISEDMIREGLHACGGEHQFHFCSGKIEELPFNDASFDIVLCLGIFEYVMEGNIAMGEIRRVLKPNGVFIATMLNKNSLYRIWKRYGYWKLQRGMNKLSNLIKKMTKRQEGAINNGGEKKGLKSRLYNEKTFRHLITSNKIRVENILYYDFNIFLAPLDLRFPRASVFVSKKLESLCRSKLKFLGTGFMLKCRKY